MAELDEIAREAEVERDREGGADEETIAWEQIAPRQIAAEECRRFEHSIAEIFTAFGMDAGSVSTSAPLLRFLKAALVCSPVRARGASALSR